MKIYTKSNFFKHTYCEFQEVSLLIFKDDPAHYKSKSDSLYHYTKEGVYRYADHWGRVANCRWKLSANSDYKSQKYHLGFAKWTDFCPLNDDEKAFFIEVDFKHKKVNYLHINTTDISDKHVFIAKEAQKRIGQVRILFSETKWAKYYSQDIAELRRLVILELTTTDKTLQQIKMALKK